MEGKFWKVSLRSVVGYTAADMAAESRDFEGHQGKGAHGALTVSWRVTAGLKEGVDGLLIH